MCLGIPMRVVECDDFTALVERRGEVRRVSALLVGRQPVGAMLLVHIDSAVRRLDADEARLIDDALDGVAAALDGRAFDHLFADLVDREPQLPDFLRPPAAPAPLPATSTPAASAPATPAPPVVRAASSVPAPRPPAVKSSVPSRS